MMFSIGGKDLGRFNEKFVKNKFDEFLKYVVPIGHDPITS